MAIIKCKMCGGDLNIIEGSTVAECEYCGTKQTVPSADNEKKLTLFARAGRLLRACEFDKAAGVFESIVADFPEEAEAYWGLVLCKYGIEYVDDPATGKKIPTCHRSSFDSVLDDPNFEQACENTDAVARRVYRDEARQIEDLRQAILQVSGKEEPYDVFISYKETDENGDRTLDSVIAQDIYKELTGEGYRVFFSRISLEDKLGTEYEPYIFAALNSAKVMLVVGTDYENFDSVWVKNEWSRFLKLIAAGQKKTLIPVFKSMDANDMPKEFKKLAAQDMGKVGAMQDLLRGVEKLVGRKKAVPVRETIFVQQGGGPNAAALLKRGQQALEDKDWEKAKGFFEQLLSMNAEDADAFFGLFLAWARCANAGDYIERASARQGKTEMMMLPPAEERISAAVQANTVRGFVSAGEIKKLFEYDLQYPSSLAGQKAVTEQEKARIENDKNLNRAFRFAKGELAEGLTAFKTKLFAQLDRNVELAMQREKAAAEKKQREYEAFLTAAEQKAGEMHRTALKAQEENQQAAEVAYQNAVKHFDQASTVEDFKAAKSDFLAISSYRNSAFMAACCDEEIAKLEKAEAEEVERRRILAERAEREQRAKQKKRRKIALVIATVVILAVIIFSSLTVKVILPKKRYSSAQKLMASGEYKEAAEVLEVLGDYQDSKALLRESVFSYAKQLFNAGNYKEAKDLFWDLYKDKDKYSSTADDQKDASSAQAEDAAATGDDSPYEWYTRSRLFLAIAKAEEDISSKEGYPAIQEMTEYEGQPEEAAEIRTQYIDWQLSTCERGDKVFFGSYPNTFHETIVNDISWEVLKTEEANGVKLVFLRAEKVFRGGAYHDKDEIVPWVQSTSCEWLNSVFYQNAFNAHEQAMILPVTIDGASLKLYIQSEKEMGKPSRVNAWGFTDENTYGERYFLRDDPVKRSISGICVKVVSADGKDVYQVDKITSPYLGMRPLVCVMIPTQQSN